MGREGGLGTLHQAHGVDTQRAVFKKIEEKTARLQMLASFKCHSLHRGTSNPPLGTRPVQAVVFMTVAREEGFAFLSFFPL